MSLEKEIIEHYAELEKIETPFYLYSEKILEEYATRVLESLGSVGEVFYALKANSNPYILEILSSFHFGADCVSGNEIELASRKGFKRIFFSGVGKTKNELNVAREKGAEINAESLEEIRLISEVMPDSEIGIRINPGVDPHTHRYITTGTEENKFGIPISRAREAFLLAKVLGIEPVRIHFHLGSQIFDKNPFIEALEVALSLAAELMEDGIKIREIDFGGGYGISYEKEDSEFLLERFVSDVKNMVSGKYRLLFEPGRFVVARCGAVVSRVLYRKAGMKNFIITDCGMNDFIRPALYGARHRVVFVPERKEKRLVADIVGPICESADFIAKNVEIALPQKGDFAVVLDAGAYGYVMSSNYNLRCKPAEYLLKKNGEIILLRKKVCPEGF